MTQAELILAHMKAGKTITQLGALREFHCLRLGARIHDLKRAGHPITKRMVTHPRTKARYAEYRMAG